MKHDSILAVGDKAPMFKLPTYEQKLISLEDYLGQPIILAFYPADWSPVCGDQMSLYNEMLPLFEQHKAVLFGISVDGLWCHQAFAQARKLNFYLLSDFHPKGDVAKMYGAYLSESGVCSRSIFVIDQSGIIVYAYQSPIGENPGGDGIIKTLESINQYESK